MRKERFRDALALVLLLVGVSAFFWPLLSGRSWIPRGGGDLVSFLWPTWRFAARSLRAGVLPLWNPTLYAGAPFAADNQSSLFYPLNLLLFMLKGEPGYRTMELWAVLHMVLAAWFTYFWLRDKGLGRAAACYGGLAYALGDVFVTHIGNLNLNATIAYLPLVLLLADRAFLRRSARWALGAGLTLGVAVLAGHGQMALYVGLALGALALYRAVGRGVWRYAPTTLALLLLIALVGALTAAVALLPNVELLRYTARAQLSWAEATRYTLPWRGLLGLVLPSFYGRSAADFWGPWERVEVGYVGLWTVALALAGLVAKGEGRVRAFPRLFLGLLLAVGLLGALGAQTPFYRLLYALPGLGGVRAPARLLILADLALAGLAAYGLERLASSRRARLVALVALVLSGAAALGLPRLVAVPPDRWPVVEGGLRLAAIVAGAGVVWMLALWRWGNTPRRVATLALVAVLALGADLTLSGARLEREPNDPTLGYQHADVVEFLRRDGGLYRIDSSAADAWQPDAAAVHDLYDIGGVPNPLNLATYQTYRWGIGGRGDRLYSLLGVKYVLANKDRPPGDARLVPVYTAGEQVDVYLNTTAYPLAQLVYHAVAVPSMEAAWERIHAATFDPSQTVVLLEPPQLVTPPAPGAPPALAITRYALNEIALQVSTPTPAYLLLSEVYYPGWRATLDGQPARILPADYLFRAIHVPAGAHEVRLVFAPPSFYAGLALSALAWLGVPCLLAAWRVINKGGS